MLFRKIAIYIILCYNNKRYKFSKKEFLFMGKGLRKRKKIIERRNAKIKSDELLIDELLDKANRHFFLNHNSKSVVLKLPDTSQEFWNALENKIYTERLAYQIRRVWYSKKRVKICWEDSLSYGYF